MTEPAILRPEGWDGIPQEPDRDGAHALRQGGRVVVMLWLAGWRKWSDGYGGRGYEPWGIGRAWEYLGPCLLPPRATRRSTDDMNDAVLRGLAMDDAHARIRDLEGALRTAEAALAGVADALRDLRIPVPDGINQARNKTCDMPAGNSAAAKGGRCSGYASSSACLG